jgi:hypothetical protein
LIKHCPEPEFGAQCNSLPDTLFGNDEIGETLTHLRQAGKRSNVSNCGLENNFDKNFFWKPGDRTSWRRGEIGWRSFALD